MTGAERPTAAFACLAIETSTQVSSIAACAGGRVARAEYGAPGEQSRQVYACVRDVLREIGAQLGDLDCVAFGCGPGGFTGLRVGAAVAQALSFGAALPVCRVSSLAVLAFGAMREHDAKRVAACVDARMGEAYLGVWRHGPGGLVAELDDRLVRPGEFRLTEVGIAERGLFAAGPGWAVHESLLSVSESRLSGVDIAAAPQAERLLSLAEAGFRAGRTVAPHQAVPNYVRDKVTSS